MKIDKKIYPQYFEKILEGKKNYELRLADWDCSEGDVLVLHEWDPETKHYTGRSLEKKVTFVGKTKDVSFWSKKEIEEYGFQIISFSD